MTFKELSKLLLQNGWIHVDTRGSHYQYEHPVKRGKVTIPCHKGDLSIKTVNVILKAAGLK